jgi:hypothetical protein
VEHGGKQHVEAQGQDQHGPPAARIGPQVSATAIDPANGYIVVDGIAHEITVGADGILRLGTTIGPQEDVPPMNPLPEESSGEAQVTQTDQPPAA